MVQRAAVLAGSEDHDGEDRDCDRPVIQRPIDYWLETQKRAASKFPEHIHMTTSGKSIGVRARSG
jgi:hypothetical protein